MKDLCFVLFIIAFISCSKDKLNEHQSQDSSDMRTLAGLKVKFQHKMLVFENLEDYLSISKSINTNDLQPKLKEIFPKFKSIEDAYFNFINSDKFKDLDSKNDIYQYSNILHINKAGEEITIEPLLYFEKAKLFNEQGMIQIGDEIIQRKYDEMKVLKANQVNDFSNLISEFLTNKTVKVSPVKLIVSSINKQNNTYGELEARTTWECVNYWCDDVASGSCGSWKYKIKGSVIIELTNPGNVLTAGARTQSYTRGTFGIWFSDKSGFYLQQSGTVTVSALSGGFPMTATVNVATQSSYVGSDNTIESFGGSPNISSIISQSYNVNITGLRYKNGLSYSKSCTIQ